MRKFLILILSVLLISGVTGCKNKTEQKQTEETVSGECGRRCLEGFVNQYLAAMVANNTSKAPFAVNARYTENAEEIPLSNIKKGLWTTATGLTSYKFYISDPHSKQVAFVGLIKTKDHEKKPVLLSMRLKVEDSKITEAEAIVVDSMMGDTDGVMAVPPAAFSQVLLPEDRVSREDLIKISNEYFDSIELGNSKIVPWSDECYRIENGMWTAGTRLPPELAAHVKKSDTPQPGPDGKTSIAFARGKCADAIDSGVFALIESISPRRTPVVDVERGVTWGVYMFNHPGVKTVTMPDGSTKPAAYFGGQPNSMPMSELFKIKDGRIRDIMAIGVIKKYKSDSGWK